MLRKSKFNHSSSEDDSLEEMLGPKHEKIDKYAVCQLKLFCNTNKSYMGQTRVSIGT